MSAHNAVGGDMIFAMAASDSYGGDGEIAIVTFGKLNPDADAASVELTEVMFNEGDPPAEIGSSAGVPAQAETPSWAAPFPTRLLRGRQLPTRWPRRGRSRLRSTMLRVSS